MKRPSALAINVFLLLSLLLTSACTKKSAQEEEAGHHDEEAEPVVVTAYSPQSELFMEYDPPVAGQKAGFLIHLTRLSDFKPVTAGELKLIFAPHSGSPLEITVPAPVRPGIYRTEVALPAAGDYNLTLVTAGKGFEDRIEGTQVHVVGEGEKPHGEEGHAHAEEESGHPEEDHAHAEGEAGHAGEEGHAHEGEAGHSEEAHGGGEGISFLKEQQWSVDFMVQPPVRRSVSTGFSVPGELVPVSNAEATVSAPLPGILSVSKSLPFPGQRIAKGDVVAVIEPSAGQQGGYGELAAEHAQAKSRLKLARSEYERARKLVEARIAPKRRLEEAQAAVETARAALAPLEQAIGSVAGGGGNRITVRAPISGTVVDVPAGNGKGIVAGEPILRIVDTSRLWLKANVPGTEAGRIDASRAAGTSFTVTGLEEEFTPSKLVSSGALIDPQTRTLPVLFEVDNGSGRLKAGMYANVGIKTGRIENALTVPREALIEDEGRWFVFVQTSGETFERREVAVGPEERGSVQIRDGLGQSERVVTRGAYYVKLASVSLKGADAHGHAH